MPVREFPFSELVRHPTKVAEAAETHLRVLLRRRGKSDLALSRADLRDATFDEADAFARLLGELLPHVKQHEVPSVVVSALPWTSYLTESGQLEFINQLPVVIRSCVDLKTLAPLDTFLASWRNTAAAQADPVLREALIKPIEMPLDQPVEAP